MVDPHEYIMRQYAIDDVQVASPKAISSTVIRVYGILFTLMASQNINTTVSLLRGGCELAVSKSKQIIWFLNWSECTS